MDPAGELRRADALHLEKNYLAAAEAYRCALSGDASLIEDRPDVMRVDFFNHERKHAQLFARRADDAHAFDGRKAFGCVSQQLMLVSGRLLATNDD